VAGSRRSAARPTSRSPALQNTKSLGKSNLREETQIESVILFELATQMKIGLWIKPMLQLLKKKIGEVSCVSPDDRSTSQRPNHQKMARANDCFFESNSN
jgi:hypothetical protein